VSAEKFIPIAAPSMSEAVALEKMNGDDRNICEVKIDECENSDSIGGDEVAHLRVTIVLTMARAGLVKSVRGVPGVLGTAVSGKYESEKGVYTAYDDVEADKNSADVTQCLTRLGCGLLS
jgi:hypothetical protein